MKKQDANDEVSTDAAQKSKELLESVEEVRPEVVERGKKLAASSDYPPADVVEKLARFLSDKLK